MSSLPRCLRAQILATNFFRMSSTGAAILEEKCAHKIFIPSPALTCPPSVSVKKASWTYPSFAFISNVNAAKSRCHLRAPQISMGCLMDSSRQAATSPQLGLAPRIPIANRAWAASVTYSRGMNLARQRGLPLTFRETYDRCNLLQRSTVA